jgi:hypothetical protein
MRVRLPWFLAGLALAAGSSSTGSVIELADRDQWTAVVGAHTTVDFTGFEAGAIIREQYAHLGVHFVDGNDRFYYNPSVFPNDEWGVDGNGNIIVSFDEPQAWIAADFPGYLRIELYRQGKLIHVSGMFGHGGPGNFGGLVSEESFDLAVLMDVPAGSEAAIDDLHFGPPPCLGDVDADALVGVTDFLHLLAAWGTDPGGPPDLDGDGNVGVTDFLILLGNWGPCSFFVDCDSDGVWDLPQIWEGLSPDCNANGAPDECDLAGGACPDCNDNSIPDECDLADETSPDCNGNDVPDECEADCDENGIPDACDIADGSLEDLDGNGIPDVCEFPNDNCEDALVITDGATPFSTVGANTDGFPAFCEGGQYNTFVKDVWFLYTAPSTAIATFSICNDADFDTRLAVYWAECPTSIGPLACSNDAPGCGQTSEIQIWVFEGLDYLVRIGGTDGHGTGVLTVSCEPGR